jgi:RNA polymerase sigma-70 factor (ECF subfamily)
VSDANNLDVRAELPRHIPALRGYARALCRDAGQADDLVQDTMLRALDEGRVWQPGTVLRAWLFTVLRHLWTEGHRTRRRRERLLSPPPQQAPGGAGTAEITDVARALDRLPPAQREALILLGGQGFSAEEAGDICGVPAATMRARAARGRLALRRIVQPAS